MLKERGIIRIKDIWIVTNIQQIFSINKLTNETRENKNRKFYMINGS